MIQEAFRIGNCSFDLTEGGTPLEHLARNDYYGDVRLARLDRFFKSVEMMDFDIAKLASEDRSYCGHAKVYANCNPPDEGCLTWHCYQAATYVAMKEAVMNLRWKIPVLGFVKQAVNGVVVPHAMLHAWVADRDGCFIDPCGQAHADDQKIMFDQQKALGRWVNMTRPRLLMSDFSEYQGVEIPLKVAVDILAEIPDKSYGNLWGYMIHKILISDEKTDWFIGVVNNGGEGWVYEGRV